jgi:hypothetical protein
MPEAVLVRVYCEGSDDKAVLDALKKGGVLSERLEIAKPSGGESNLAHDVAPFVSPEAVDGRAIVLRDLDDLDAGGVGSWFEKELRARLSPAVTLTAKRADHARVTTYEALKGDRRGFADGALYQGEKDVEIDHTLAHHKLGEVLELLKANGIPATKSKRLMHLFRAIIGFRAAPATFAERLVSKAIGVRGANAVAGLMQPLVGDIDQALAAIG